MVPLPGRQHGSRAGGNVHVCVGGDGVQERVGAARAAGEGRGGGPLAEPAGLALSGGGADPELVLKEENHGYERQVPTPDV